MGATCLHAIKGGGGGVAHAHTCRHTQKCTDKHKHINTHTAVYADACVYTWVLVLVLVLKVTCSDFIHTCLNTYVQISIHMCRSVQFFVYVHICTYMCTHLFQKIKHNSHIEHMAHLAIICMYIHTHT